MENRSILLLFDRPQLRNIVCCVGIVELQIIIRKVGAKKKIESEVCDTLCYFNFVQTQNLQNKICTVGAIHTGTKMTPF